MHARPMRVALAAAVVLSAAMCDSEQNPFRDPANVRVDALADRGHGPVNCHPGDTVGFHVAVHLPYLTGGLHVAFGDSTDTTVALTTDERMVDDTVGLLHVYLHPDTLWMKATASPPGGEPRSDSVLVQIAARPLVVDTPPEIFVTAPDLRLDSAVVDTVLTTVTFTVTARAGLASVTARLNGASMPVLQGVGFRVDLRLLPAQWNTLVLTAQDQDSLVTSDTVWLFCRAGLAAPGAPTMVDRLCAAVQLSWSGNNACDQYMLWRRRTTGPDTLVYRSADTCAMDSLLATGTDYQYAVQGLYERQNGSFTVADTSPLSTWGAARTVICYQDTLSTASDDIGMSVVAMPDGGYLVCGTNGSFTPEQSDVWLIRFDSTGNRTLEKVYAIAQDQKGYYAAPAPAGGYALATSQGAWLADQTGDVFQSLDLFTYYCPPVVTFAGDGGLLIAHKNDDSTCLTLTRTRADGYVLDQRCWAWAALCPTGIALTPDDGVAVVAEERVLRVGAGFDTLWTRPLPFWGTSLALRPDGAITVVGKAHESGQPTASLLAAGLADDGQSLWLKAYSGLGSDQYGPSVAGTRDGGFVAAATTGSSAWLLRMDSDCDTLWTRTYGGLRSAQGHAAAECLDRGFVLVGAREALGQSGWRDLYIVKTDRLGNTVPLE